MENNLTEDWLQNHWRPAIGWLYIIICAFDFIIFPIASALWSAHVGVPFDHWQPLTLSSGGLFHIAFGAILGVTSYGRTQEKLSENVGQSLENKVGKDDTK